MPPVISRPIKKPSDFGAAVKDQYVNIRKIKSPNTSSIFVSLSNLDVEPVVITLEFKSDSEGGKNKSKMSSPTKKPQVADKKLDSLESKPEHEPTHTKNPEYGQTMKSSSPKESKRSNALKPRKMNTASGPDYILTRLLQKLYIARKLLQPVIKDVIDRAVCSASHCCEGQCRCVATDEVNRAVAVNKEMDADCTCGDCCRCAELNNALHHQEPITSANYNVELSMEMLQQLEAIRGTNLKKKAAATKYFEFQNSKDLINHLEALRDLLLATIEEFEGKAVSIAVRKTSKTSDIPHMISEEGSVDKRMQAQLSKLRKEHGDLCKNVEFLKEYYKDPVSLVESNENDLSSRKVASTGSVPKIHLRVTNMAGAKRLILEILGEILDLKNFRDGSSTVEGKKLDSGQNHIVSSKTKNSYSDTQEIVNGRKIIENEKLYSNENDVRNVSKSNVTSKEDRHSKSSVEKGTQNSQFSAMMNSKQEFITNRKSANAAQDDQQDLQSNHVDSRKYSSVSQKRELRDHPLTDKVANGNDASQLRVQPKPVYNNDNANIDQSKQKGRQKERTNEDNKPIDNQEDIQSTLKDSEKFQLKEKKRQNHADAVDDRGLSSPMQPKLIDSDKNTGRSDYNDKINHKPQADKVDDRSTARPRAVIDSNTDSEGDKWKEKRHRHPSDVNSYRPTAAQPSVQPTTKDSKKIVDEPKLHQQVRANEVDDRSIDSQKPTLTDSYRSPSTRRKHKSLVDVDTSKQTFMESAQVISSKIADTSRSKANKDQQLTDKVQDAYPQSKEETHLPQSDHRSVGSFSSTQPAQKDVDRLRSKQNQKKYERPSFGVDDRVHSFIQATPMDYNNKKNVNEYQPKQKKYQPAADKINGKSTGSQQLTEADPNKAVGKPLTKYQSPTNKVDKRPVSSQSPAKDSDKPAENSLSKEDKHQPVQNNVDDRTVASKPLKQTPKTVSNEEQKPIDDRSSGNQPFIKTDPNQGTDRPQWKQQKHPSVAHNVDTSTGNQQFIQTPIIDSSKSTGMPQSREKRHQPVVDKVDHGSTGNEVQNLDFNKGSVSPQMQEQKYQPITDKVDNKSTGNLKLIQTPVMNSRKGAERPQAKENNHEPVVDKVDDGPTDNQAHDLDKDSKRPQMEEQKHQPVTEVDDKSTGNKQFIPTPVMNLNKGIEKPQAIEKEIQPLPDKVDQHSADNQVQGLDSNNGAVKPQAKDTKRHPVVDKVDDGATGNQTQALEKGSERPQLKEQKHQPVIDKVDDKSTGNHLIQSPVMNLNKGAEKPQAKEKEMKPVADKVDHRPADNQAQGLDSYKGSEKPQAKENKHQPVVDKVDGKSTSNQQLIQTPVTNLNEGAEKTKEKEIQPVADKVDDRPFGLQPLMPTPVIEPGTMPKKQQQSDLVDEISDRNQPSLNDSKLAAEFDEVSINGQQPEKAKLVPSIQNQISRNSKESNEVLHPGRSNESHTMKSDEQKPMDKVDEDNKVEEKAQDESSVTHMPPQTATSMPVNDESFSTLDGVSSSLDDDVNPYIPSESSLPIFSSVEDSLSSSKQMFHDNVQVVQWLSSSGIPYIPSSASMPKFRDNVSDVLIGYVAVESNSDLPYRPSENSLPEFPNNVRDCKEEKRRCATLVGKPSCGLPYVPSISSLPQKIDQTETSKFIFTDDKDTGGNLVSLSPIMNLRKQNQTDAVIEPMNPMKLRMLVRKPSFGIPYTPSLSSLPQEIDQQQPLYVKEVFVYDDSPSVVPKLSCEIPYEASVASLPIKAEIKPMDKTELSILDIKSSSEIPYVASASSMPHIVHNPSSHDSILQHANLDDHNQTIAKVDVMSSEISNSAHDMIPVSILKSWPVKNVNNTTFKSSNEVHISQKNGGTSEDLPEEKDTVKRLRYSQNATEKCHSIEVKYGPVDQSNNSPDDTVHSDFKGGTNWRNKTGINGKSCPQKSAVNNSYLKTERSVRNATYKLRRVKTSKFRQSKKNLSNSDRWKIRKELNINFSHKKSRYVMISVTKSCPGAIEKSKLTYFNQKKETLRVSSFAETKNFLKSLKAMSDAHILNKQIKDVSQYFTVKELVKKRSVVQFENSVQNCPIIMVAGAGSISGDVSEPEVSAAAVSSTQQPRIDYIDRDTKMPTTIGELIDLIHQVQRDDTQEVCTICGIPNTLYSHQNSKEELTDYGAEGSTSSTPDDNSKESSGSSVTVEKLDAYPRGSHPNSRVSWPPNSRLEEVQSASSSKGTKSRKSQMSRDHNYDDHSISQTTGDHPERLSNQVNQMNEPFRNTQVPNQISESYRGQDRFYSENQSRDTAASFSKHSTSGREPGSVYSERSTNNPSDIFHSFPRSSGQQPRQTSIGIAGSMTSQAPSQLPNQSMMGKVFSTSKQSGGKTVSIAPVQPTEQQNACYCRFEKKVNSKFPFPKTVSADVPSASSRFGTLQYSQGRSTQNSLPRTSKFVNAHSVPQAVNTSSRPHSSSGSQMQSSHIHEEKSYAAPTTYVNENGHYSSLQSSREVNQGANPVLMGANGLVAGIQISLIPQHFAYQNTKPTSSFLTGSSNDDNVGNSDTSRVRTTEPGQTNTRRTSRAPIQHTIPSDFKHSQPSYRSSGDSHSVMGGQQPISEESSHQNYRNANVSITKPSVSNERIDVSQRNFGTVSNLPASSQKSIPSKSTINVERDEYPHSNYFSDQLIYNRRYYNSGDISEGDGDALLNGQPQHEKSFGHTSQRIQSYSEPPAPVHILRNSAQGSSFKENSLSQNMAPQGNGSKFTLQLPPFTAESNNVETDNNIISRAIDAVKPICHCRDSADFGIFVTVPCNDDTRERRAFCYQESCPSNCLDSEIPQYPVARHPSETSQLQQTGRWDYPFSNLPAGDTLQYLDHQPEPCSCQPEEFEDHSHNDDVSRNISHRSFTDDHLSGTRSVPVTVIRSGEYPSMIPATRQPTLLSNAASFGNRVKHIDQPCAATSREAMPQQVYMKDVVDKDQVGVPPSSSSNLDKVLWALAKVSIYDDGTRMFEILEASPIPPGHYFLPDNDEE